MMIAACSPQESEAAEFTNKDFLELTPVQQKAWLLGSMETFWQIAAQRDREIGQCIYDWYFGGDQTKRNGLILASMEKYPDHSPPVVLMALTERECGKYVKIPT